MRLATFLEVDGESPAAQRARVLRHHRSDGDPTVANDTECRQGDGGTGGEDQKSRFVVWFMLCN